MIELLLILAALILLLLVVVIFAAAKVWEELREILHGVQALGVSTEQQIRSTRHAMKSLDAAVRLLARLPPPEERHADEELEPDDRLADR